MSPRDALGRPGCRRWTLLRHNFYSVSKYFLLRHIMPRPIVARLDEIVTPSKTGRNGGRLSTETIMGAHRRFQSDGGPC
ncbi:hypothetical protein X963_3839 [Burkholderia pseudomallei MSHR7498]|nr:hypothetical protein X963_3839 [Burkholderia pseudomallei MSHR7498]